jgi:hypothetical protein
MRNIKPQSTDSVEKRVIGHYFCVIDVQNK